MGVGRWGYYVSSDVEWSILVMGHQQDGGGREEERMRLVSSLQFKKLKTSSCMSFLPNILFLSVH